MNGDEEIEKGDVVEQEDQQQVSTSDGHEPDAPEVEEPEVEESEVEEPETGDTNSDELDEEETLEGGPVKIGTAAELDEEVLLSRIESLVFVSPDPISVRRLARILSLPGQRIRELVAILAEHYQSRGIILQEISGGFQFRSHPDNAPVVRHVFKMRPLKISRAALETLSIVAYRQPLTRAEVEQIRGVDCGGVLKYLFEKNLVRVIGRKEEPGRPIIYGTSSTFLELFGLKALSDLPALHEFSELWEEHQEMVDTETPLEESDGGAESDGSDGSDGSDRSDGSDGAAEDEEEQTGENE